MTVQQGLQDIVFGINRFHNLPGRSMTIDIVNSSPANFGCPWENVLNGHPSVPGKSTDIGAGHAGGINLWFDFNRASPNDAGYINCVGLVNTEWTTVQTISHQDLAAGVMTDSTAGGAGSWVFQATANDRRINTESSTGKTWMIQLTSTEHGAPSTQFQRYAKINFDSYVTNGQLRWVSVGEVFFGMLYHPPGISWELETRIRPSMILNRSRDGWTWTQRIGSATREHTLTWEGLTTEEKIELEQFSMNAGDPWFADELSYRTAPRPNMNDFGSPMLLSLPDEAFSTNSNCIRNAHYVVIDPTSPIFRRLIGGRWNAQIRFFEVV